MDGFPLVARVSFFLHVSGSVIDDCEHLSLLSYSSISLDDAKSKNSSMITRFRPNRGLLNNSERILSFLLALFSYSLYPSILLYRMEILPKTPWLHRLLALKALLDLGLSKVRDPLNLPG